MNRTSSGSMRLEKAIQGFIQSKQAEGCSDNTIVTYTQQMGVWREYAGDVQVNDVTSQDVRAFLAWMRTGYEPRRIAGGDQPLAPKTIRNFWVTLSAFFTWASEEFGIPSPGKGVHAPKFEETPVETFKREEVELLLKAADYLREAKSAVRQSFTMRRATANRDHAIILFLLDTVLRPSELCALNVGDVDLKSGKVVVKHEVGGGAKGGKGRVVFLGKACRRTV